MKHAEIKLGSWTGMFDMESDLRWCLHARSNDKERKVLHLLHIPDEHTAVCTDGRRLHMVKRNGEDDFLPVGNWRVLSIAAKLIICEEDKDGIFPNWKHIVPDLKTGEVKSHSFDLPFSGDKACNTFSLVQGLMNIGVKGMNMDYIWHAVGDEKFFTTSVKDDGYTKNPVVFNYGNRTALIMPF